MKIKDDVFKVEIEKSGAKITTASNDFKFEFKKGTRAHVVLLYLSKENAVNEILTLCQALYMAATGIFSDAQYVKDLIKLTSEWSGKLIEKAKIKAAEVTDEEDKEALHEVKSIIEKSNQKK